MEQHKISTKKSLRYEDTVEVRCTCGFYASSSKTKFYTTSMRTVWEEARFMNLDHLEEVSEKSAA
jgi:hypothetical protein